MICRFNKFTNIPYKNLIICVQNGIRHESAATVALDYQQIPSPKGLPFLGTTLSLILSGGAPHLHVYVDRRHRELGPIFKDKIGPVSAVFLSDPELMRHVFAQEGKCPIHILPEAWSLYNELYGCSRGLFFMDGEEWLTYRRIMNKLLLKGDSKWIEEICQVVSNDLIERWRILASIQNVLPNLEAELYRWSLNTIVAVLLGKTLYQKSKIELNQLLENLAATVHLIFETTVPFQIVPAKFAAKFNTRSWQKFVKCVDDALILANKLIEKLLVKVPESDGLLLKMLNEKIPTLEMKRIVIDLVLAAGDTTAYTMSWLLYSLAKNRQIQNDVRHSSSPLALKNAIRECLRLYPVAPFLTRILPQNTLVGGYEIPAGTLTLFSIYTSGRDSRFFQDPDVFWPDRWLRENSTTSMHQVCIPFSFGARSCIGKKIAEYQLQTSLENLIKNFDLELKNKKEIEVVLKMVVVPSHPIRLKLNQL